MSYDPLVESLTPLFRRLARGDQTAIGEIVDYCHQRFLAMARRMLGRCPAFVRLLHRPSDVVSETYPDLLRALRTIPFHTPVHFLRLAAMHMRWTLRDLARKDAHTPIPGVFGVADAAGKLPTPSDETVDLATWAEVHKWIDDLPADERLLYDLLFYCELTQAEAAEELGVCERTVRRAWLAARLKFMGVFGFWFKLS